MLLCAFFGPKSAKRHSKSTLWGKGSLPSRTRGHLRSNVRRVARSKVLHIYIYISIYIYIYISLSLSLSFPPSLPLSLYVSLLSSLFSLLSSLSLSLSLSVFSLSLFSLFSLSLLSLSLSLSLFSLFSAEGRVVDLVYKFSSWENFEDPEPLKQSSSSIATFDVQMLSIWCFNMLLLWWPLTTY